LLCHGTVCVVGKIRDLILQLSKSSIYSTKPLQGYSIKLLAGETGVSEQALLSRKHKAVLFLRTRLRDVYDALTGG
ncbi:hypothetical protein AB9D27_08860, partial [Enterobacter cloacae]